MEYSTKGLNFCLSLIIGSALAQTPNSFKYQAVVRNSSGQIIVNQNVGFRFSILQNSSTGSSVYSEKHTTQTNAFGLVNLEIGKGTVLSGTFSAINWGSGSKTTDGTGTGAFQSQITGLIPGTYYVRAYATNSAGSGYGNMITFSTEKTLPVLTTKTITDISAMGAVSGGNITSSGGGTISGRGICWSDSPNTTITNDKTTSTATSASFSAAIAKATPGTTYYLKAYATNEIGTGYGDQKTFTTSDAAYYQSFEAGMTPAGWTGPFTVTNENAFEGSYSFKSLTGSNCDAILTTTLLTGGQISFYYSFANGSSIDFYIDVVKITNFPNDGGGWRQGLAPVTTGSHTFKWHFNIQDYVGGKCYIDQIIITK